MNGDRLLYLIKAKGMSQKEFAQAVGITSAALCRYIKGKREPTTETLAVIADGLGVDLYELLDSPCARCKRRDGMRSRPSDIRFNVQGLREKLEEVYGGNLAELARVSDVPSGTLYSIINKRSMPHLDTAVKLADALRVDLVFLVERGQE